MKICVPVFPLLLLIFTFLHQGKAQHPLSLYYQGMADGEYVDHYPNGQTKVYCHVVYGFLHGEYLSYFKSGQTLSTDTFHLGKQLGKSLRFNEDGQIIREAFYQYDTLHYYKVFSYHNNGKLKLEYALDFTKKSLGVNPFIGIEKKSLSSSIEFDISASIKQLKSEGKALHYFANGTLSEQYELKNGVRHGKGTLYFKNGAKKAECSYKNGKLDGHYTTFNKKGKIRKVVLYRDSD